MEYVEEKTKRKTWGMMGRPNMGTREKDGLGNCRELMSDTHKWNAVVRVTKKHKTLYTIKECRKCGVIHNVK